MPSLLSSSSGQASSLTWGQAKARVARSGSGSNVPENLVVAGEALQETIQFWNARKHWRFLHVLADDITLVSGTAEYALPTNCKTVYAAWLEGVRQPLHHVEPRLRGEAGYITPSNGLPTMYEVFNTATTGNITLVPTPDSATYGPLVVYYYRDMVSHASDTDILDCPARYEHAIIAGARVRYLALKGDESAKIQVWNKMAEEGLMYAIGDDNNQPDMNKGFIPEAVIGGSGVLAAVDGIVIREDYW